MYENQAQGAGVAGRLVGRGLGDSALAARPVGHLSVAVQQLEEVLQQISGQKNRLHSISERILNPRPVGVGEGGSKASAIPNTLESKIESLTQSAMQTYQELSEIADRLDGAL